MFMMYFIYNILTNMFQPVIQSSSGRCYYYDNKIVVLCVTVTP